MGMLEQVGFHPWPAILGGVAVVLNALLLMRRPRGSRAWLLPGIAGFACAAVAAGVFWSAWITIEGFRAMALTGSGGQGSVAALLAEARSAFFAGPVAAALVIANGLLLAGGRDGAGAVDASSGSSMASQMSAFLVLSALMAALVAALSTYDIVFAASLLQQVFAGQAQPGPAAETIAGHLVRLQILSGLGFAASAVLAILPAGLRAVDWPPRSLVLWGRALLIVLLILAVTGAVALVRQHDRFAAAAMTGQLE
jgi:hypothetical protein